MLDERAEQPAISEADRDVTVENMYRAKSSSTL
jgi:hypothetical protein